MNRLLIPLVIISFATGCRSHYSEGDIDRGRRAVITALDSWKANDSPAKLKTLADPVDFTEELRSTQKLTDYTIGKVDTSDKEVIRYTVTLQLKDKKGKLSIRDVVYAVALKAPVVVSRDPYF